VSARSRVAAARSRLEAGSDIPEDILIYAIAFDIGETVLCESRSWEQWAAWLGVPKLTFFSLLGAMIERREPHQRALEQL
jgi:hypothetical protein